MTIGELRPAPCGVNSAPKEMEGPKDIDAIRWFHKVDLGDGRVTDGRVDIESLETPYLFDQLDFNGKSVIDIGCWDGYFSFMAEKRGASRVVGFDDPAYRWGGMDGFNFLKDHFKSNVEWQRGTVYRMPEERFDIVLCYGVLYHINDPFTAATNCFQSANERALFEGLIFDANPPISILLKPGEISNDKTNMYSISTGFLDRIAEMNGFVREALVSLPANPPEPARERCALMYKRVTELKPKFSSYCFSTPPTCLED